MPEVSNYSRRVFEEVQSNTLTNRQANVYIVNGTGDNR